MTCPDWNALRDEFPTLANWTFLDVARKTVPPRCQERALREYWRDVVENAGADAWSAGNVAETRVLMAQLLGAKPSEIAFTKNTTEGLNIAAHGFRLNPGDNIVLTDMEHVANVWVWKHWEAKGVELRIARNREGRLPLDCFLEQMDERTRVVSTAYVTYGNGYRVNLPELGRACRERGARLVVDGVQAAGILATPLNGLGADIIAIGGHKGLFGLAGSGVVYCREELVNELQTDFVKQAGAGPETRAHLVSQFDYMRTAHRFEGGNPNFLGIRVLRHGAQFIQSIGLTHIEQRVRDLTTTCLKLLRAAGLDSLTPEVWEERAQIVNVLVPNAAALMERLREKHRIVTNVKDDALRLSMSFFNNEEDLERAVHALKRELA
ncbi:MAG: aminotransferase class V-fold PLP-dependent enzyme [Betaproteobacteria bacterium]|nr:aminotransferase class V-fold PLP-dependent enzyme [Betaproteobacteria bacterium]